MKAEHRKELQTNALADRLGKALQGMKEGPSRTTMVYVGIAVLVVLGYFAWRWFSTSAEESNSARWFQWDSLTTPTQVENFAHDKDASETVPGKLARFQVARMKVLNGVRDLPGEPAKARKAIQEGAEAYVKLIEETRDMPLLQQEAMLGAAQAYESLFDLDKAQQHYQKLADTYPDSAFGKDARQQLDRLKKEGADKDLQDLARRYKETGSEK